MTPVAVDPHQHLSRTWMWLWHVFIHEVIGTATAMDTDRFHFLLSSTWEMNPDHRQGAVIG